MSRPAPRFSEGEDVIGYYPAMPAIHGQKFFVQEVRWFDRWGCYGYKILSGKECLPGRFTGNPSQFAGEDRLIKKPLPSTESFDQLMQGLKRPQGVVV